VEVDAPGSGLRNGRVRVTTDDTDTRAWFDWAWLGADAAPTAAAAAGLTTTWVREAGGRWFTELVKS
jgi:hypothetical protein